MRSAVVGPVTVASIDPLDSALVLNSFGIWIDRLGYVIESSFGSTHASQLYAIQLDGKGIRIGGQSGPVAGPPSALGWSPTVGTARAAAIWPFDHWQEIEIPSFARRSALSASYVSGLAQTFGVMSDRLIAVAFDKVKTVPLAGGSSTDEYAFASLPFFTNLTHIAYAGQVGGNHRWWCGALATGFLCLYDATAKVEVAGKRTFLGTGFQSFGYSVKHDLFIVHRFESSADKLYVYANEAVATSITAPTFAGTVMRGQRVTATSTVLGASSDPCVGRNVTFAATHGRFDPVTVATDQAGNATTTYFAPFAAGTDPVSATLVE